MVPLRWCDWGVLIKGPSELTIAMPGAPRPKPDHIERVFPIPRENGGIVYRLIQVRYVENLDIGGDISPY